MCFYRAYYCGDENERAGRDHHIFGEDLWEEVVLECA